MNVANRAVYGRSSELESRMSTFPAHRTRCKTSSTVIITTHQNSNGRFAWRVLWPDFLTVVELVPELSLLLQYRGVEVSNDLLADRLHIVRASGPELEIQDIGSPFGAQLNHFDPVFVEFVFYEVQEVGALWTRNQDKSR